MGNKISKTNLTSAKSINTIENYLPKDIASIIHEAKNYKGSINDLLPFENVFKDIAMDK